MLKNKSKIVVLLIAIIMLFSSISFATEGTSTMPGDNARTATEENNGEQGVTPTSEEGVMPISEGEPTTTEGTDNTVGTDTTDGENGEVATDEIHNGDLYLFDNNVVMDKLVDGNVFIVGQNVEVTGRVNGSLYVLANKVTFGENSYVVQSIYACANEIVLNGAANDLYASASKVDVNYNAFMIRDLRVNADTVNFAGGVGRNAYIDANDFTFETESGKSAIVYGNLEYKANKELELSKELVQGEIKYSKQLVSTGTSVVDVILNKVIEFIGTLIFTIVVFALMLLFAPKFVETSANYVGKKGAIALGIGILGAIIAVVVSIALLFSVVGVPLAFAIIALFALMMAIAFTVTATCITYKLKDKFKNDKKYMKFIILAVVTLVIWLLQQIPYAGEVIGALVTFVGFGIIVLHLYTKIRKKEIAE